MSWLNLWDLLEFGHLNLLYTTDTQFVCTDDCIGENYKVSDFGRRQLEAKGRNFRNFELRAYNLTLVGFDNSQCIIDEENLIYYHRTRDTRLHDESGN